MPFGGLLAGVFEDLLGGFQIALVTGVCRSCLSKLTRGPTRDFGFFAGVADGGVQSVLCVTVPNFAGFGLVTVGFSDEFFESDPGIKNIIRAAHFAEPVQDLLTLSHQTGPGL